jgi:hypothetical protein
LTAVLTATRVRNASDPVVRHLPQHR